MCGQLLVQYGAATADLLSIYSHVHSQRRRGTHGVKMLVVHCHLQRAPLLDTGTSNSCGLVAFPADIVAANDKIKLWVGTAAERSDSAAHTTVQVTIMLALDKRSYAYVARYQPKGQVSMEHVGYYDSSG